MRWRTYLNHPHPFPTTLGNLWTTLTCRTVEDDSKCDIEKSVQGEGLTRLHRRVEAELGDSDASYKLYMDRMRYRSDPEARDAKMRPQDSIEDDGARGTT
jgi:hypothetical protein